jgi:hypothetical protein
MEHFAISQNVRISLMLGRRFYVRKEGKILISLLVLIFKYLDKNGKQ